MSTTTAYRNASRSPEASSLREVRRRLSYRFAIGDTLIYQDWRIYRHDQYHYSVANLRTLEYAKFLVKRGDARKLNQSGVNLPLTLLIERVVQFIQQEESSV